LLTGFAQEQGSTEDHETARTLLAEALELVRSLDPSGIATRDLRECLTLQVRQQEHEYDLIFGEADADIEDEAEVVARRTLFRTALQIIDECLPLLQKRDLTALGRAVSKPQEHVQQAVELIRALDPRPGQRYNRSEARLIEPDVVFVKRGDEFVVVMNEEDLPTLRLNQGYRKLLTQSDTEREVKDYVKERYRSALQLIRNIEQRKSTILRTCEAIVRRQPEFLERGVDALRPMMIKDVAEEIGVHPSTVSRAVSNKYVHTPQGVFELRYFFSEAAGGPEGAGTPLMLLRRKVKKLIDEEDPKKPLTDDFIASVLQSQGIQVTRRTVAKYREDLRIPSTHQRRVRV
jgi:RNA polymerase sigma-54 factor